MVENRDAHRAAHRHAGDKQRLLDQRAHDSVPQIGAPFGLRDSSHCHGGFSGDGFGCRLSSWLGLDHMNLNQINHILFQCRRSEVVFCAPHHIVLSFHPLILNIINVKLEFEKQRSYPMKFILKSLKLICLYKSQVNNFITLKMSVGVRD